VELIDYKQIAEKYGYNLRTILNMSSSDDKFPAPVCRMREYGKAGKPKNVYSEREIIAYMEKRQTRTQENIRIKNLSASKIASDMRQRDDAEFNHKSTNFDDGALLMRHFITRGLE